MSDLQIPAREAVEQVQPLLEALEEATRDSQEAVGHLHALRAQVAADRQAMHDLMAAVQEDVGQSEQLVAEVVAGAAGNLEKLAEMVGAAATGWRDLHAKEEEALTTGAGMLTELGPRVKDLAEKTEAAGQGVVDHFTNVSQQLADIVDGIEQAIGVGLAAGVAGLRRDAEASVAKIVDFFEKKCEDFLADKETAWKDKLGQVQELMSHSLETIATHEQEVAAYVVEHWTQLFQAQLESTQGKAHELGEALSSLRLATQNYDGQIEVAAGMVAEQQQQAADHAAKLSDGLHHTRSRWSTFGIG